MKIIICRSVIIIIFGIQSLCYATFEKLEVGAQSIALGNALVAMKGSPYSLYYNPANIQVNQQTQIVFDYQNFYGIADLNQFNMIANFNINNIPLSTGINHFGNKLYQELQFILGSSYNLTDKASIGVSFQLYSLQIRGYGQQSTWGIHLGFQYYLLDDLSVGAFSTNLNQPTIGNIKEKLPQTFSLGFCYQPSNRLLINFELFRDVRFEQDYRAGFSYDIISNLFLRIGIEDKTESYSLGTGIFTELIKFDYAIKLHQTLGTSHIVSLMFEI